MNIINNEPQSCQDLLSTFQKRLGNPEKLTEYGAYVAQGVDFHMKHKDDPQYKLMLTYESKAMSIYYQVGALVDHLKDDILPGIQAAKEADDKAAVKRLSAVAKSHDDRIEVLRIQYREVKQLYMPYATKIGYQAFNKELSKI